MGLLALVAQAGQVSWARNWPLAFFGLSAFLFLRSDPETWPLGPVGFWATLALNIPDYSRYAVSQQAQSQFSIYEAIGRHFLGLPHGSRLV